MSTDENKALIRGFYDEVWNKGNLEMINRYLAPGYVDHDAQKNPLGLAGTESSQDSRTAVQQNVMALRSAFPDVGFVTEFQVAEGDMVVTYYTASATQTGSLGPLPATNRSAAINGISIDRVSGGQIVESWSIFDSLGLLEQLGAIQSAQPVG